MLSLIELALLIAVFFTLRALSRWLKAYVARVESKDLRMKTLGLFAAVLPFPAPGKTGVARHLFWVPAQLLVLIVLYVTYCMARIAYWDHEVRQLCAKDGGVTIYERIEISREEAELLGKVGGFMSPPIKALATSNSIVYSDQSNEINIRTPNPHVYRSEYEIRRAGSALMIAKSVRYARIGGDPIGPWMPSSYSCPASIEAAKSIHQIFMIK